MTLNYKSDGKAIIRLPVSEKHKQAFGRVHGGVLAAMLDTAIAVLINQVLGPDARTTTVELKVNFLQAATGPHLMAEAGIIKLGRTLVIAEAKCYENDILLVATACGTFYRAAGKWEE